MGRWPDQPHRGGAHADRRAATDSGAAGVIVTYEAHHALVIALPALTPAVILVAVVLFIAIRDRRRGEAGADSERDEK